MNEWHPRLARGKVPLHDKLLAALERDIQSGILPAGARLPSQRSLAHDLGLGVGTVTKAFEEAARRGLITGHVGRGSFVSDGAELSGAGGDMAAGAVDLAHNLPPAEPARRHLSETVARLTRRVELADLLDYAPPAGFDRHRAAAAEWLKQTRQIDVPRQLLVLCNGAQHGLSLSLAALSRPGDKILCEEATFFGMRTLAEQTGYRLCGVRLDAQGMIPEALDREAAASGSKLLYVIPTLQNPTGRTMGMERRKEIAAIARRRGLHIIEDDIYAAYARDLSGLPTFYSLAPERTFYVSSISKTLTPGLRVGILLCPDEAAFERVLRGVRAHAYTVPSFGGLILTQWIETGTAAKIADAVISEMRKRTALAIRILGKFVERPAGPQTLHVWLPMPEMEAERTANRAFRAGVTITPPSAPIVKGAQLSGIRLCLGAARDLGTLEQALRSVRSALAADTQQPAGSVV